METAFYYIFYKRQVLRGGEWLDTQYENEKIIVIADNQEIAKVKIIDALKKAEHGNYRAFPTCKIKKTYALLVSSGFEGGNYVCCLNNDSHYENDLNYEKLI